MSGDDPHAIVARGYDRIADRYLDWSTDHSVRRIRLDQLKAELAPPARVLDLGCGAGVPVTRWLSDAGYTVTGVDGSAAQITRARINVSAATFIHADMTAVDFDAGSFDAVVATYAITHVARDRHADLFAAVHQWLRPGGFFLASLGVGETTGWQGEWLGTEMFFSNWDAATNLDMLTAAGFDLIRADEVTEDEEANKVTFLWILARAR